MFIDSRSLPQGTAIETEICIIGAGAAGITLARQLRQASFRVALLESGNFEFDDATQDLYDGDIVGLHDEALNISRLRFFGGSTNHWAGWCRPLDPVDFEPRPGMALTGWPFGREELDPYYRLAQPVCELGPFAYDDMAFWARQTGQGPLALDPKRLRSGVFQVSPPTRFGETYREDLQQAGNVTVYLNANVLEIETDPTAASVTGVRASAIGGPVFSVAAKYVVLATGGLENARLLLLSNKTQSAGLGNGHDMVGRCFMDHPWLTYAGAARFTAPDQRLSLFFGETPALGTSVFAALLPAATEMRESGIGSFRIVLQPLRRVIEGIDSLRTVAHSLKSGALPDHLWDHLGNILHDYDAIADSTYRTVTGRRTSPFSPKTPTTGPYVGASLDMNFEQMPNPASRVTLSDRRDALGQNRIALDWQLGETERRTYRRALELVALEFGRIGLGRVLVKPLPDGGAWPAEMEGSRHHMGTTRMSTDPKTGVVDAAGRVHGISNLFVAGSSVFPTSGSANPTLTIVALALRLGDELRRRMV